MNMKSKPLTVSMRSHFVPERRKEDEEIERLLERLRREVAQLHRLERVSHDDSDLRTSRQTIGELHWRLARLAGDHARRSPVAR
jgi:hypothetical protein